MTPSVVYVICFTGSVNGKDENGTDAKSPISLVHEVALRHKFPVSFEVVNMTGPPHMRSFRTVCIVGDWKTEGVGNSKKVSKLVADLSDLPLSLFYHFFVFEHNLSLSLFREFCRFLSSFF